MVFLIPDSKFSLAFQPSSFSILEASIAYLKSCPGLSFTNVIWFKYDVVLGFNSSNISQIFLAI